MVQLLVSHETRRSSLRIRWGRWFGSAALQIAKSMAFTVYTTAGEKPHGYLKSLGASRTFDYKAENVVEMIMKAAKEDGLTVHMGYDAVDQLKPCLEILKATNGERIAKLAETTAIREGAPTMKGVERTFIVALADPKERAEFFHFMFGI